MDFTVHWTHLESGKKGTRIYNALSPSQMAVYLATWNAQGTYYYCCPAVQLSTCGGVHRWGPHPALVKDLGLTN